MYFPPCKNGATSVSSQPTYNQKLQSMSSSESFVKDMFASFVRTLFKVLAFGFGLILLLIGLGIFFGGGESSRATTLHVLPNAQWKTRPFSPEVPAILNIKIDGAIGLDRHLNSDEIKLQLMDSIDGQMKPGQVRGILVTINSPGGSADDSDAIYQLLKTYKARYNVPVWAYVRGLCASGGMYIACAADKVYATPDSIIGHVGVLFSPPFFNVTGLMKKLGVESKTLSAGKNKDSLNPFRPWDADEGSQFQYLVDFMYGRFVDIVVENRPRLSRDSLIEQGARLWPAPNAKELGYIDETIGSIDEMLDAFTMELGIKDSYQFIALERHDFLESLVGAKTEALASLFGPKIVQHKIQLPGELPEEFSGKLLYMYQS